MYTRAFRYERADDLRAACAALRAHGEGAQVWVDVPRAGVTLPSTPRTLP